MSDLTVLLGDAVDLQAIADRIHDLYFRHLSRIPCTWKSSSPRMSGRGWTLAHYHSADGGSITVSRRMRLHWVPRLVLEDTIFHEYLHHEQAANGSKLGHDAEFRRREQQFPGHAESEQWINEHLGEIISPTDRVMARNVADLLDAAVEVDDRWIEERRPKKDDDDNRQPPNRPPNRPTDHDGAGGDDGDDQVELRNEFADADQLVRDIIGTAWFCPQRASLSKGDLEAGWLTWDGKRLRPSEDGAILRLARRTALRLSDLAVQEAQSYAADIRAEENCEPPDKDTLKKLRSAQARALSRADQLQTENRMQRMVSLARSDERLIIDQRELDSDSDILNCQNGVVHLPTGELRPHDPSYRCTRITAVPYDADADRSQLDRLLRRACMRETDQPGQWEPDGDRIRYLQDAIGQGLYGHQRMQRFYLCLGKGGDGKGTLFEALLDCLGGGHDGYAMKANMQSFVRQKMAGHRVRDDLANMAGARLVLASENNKGDALDAAFVKTLSGEDVQRTRHLFGKEFEFRPICTLFMQANHEPYVDSQDDAIWRRLVHIPFGPSLREEERDPEVRAALHDPQTGGAALLAWAIEGARRTYGAKRIEPTTSVDAATQQYRHEINPLAGWMIEDLRFADSPEMAARTFVAQRAIRPSYLAWLTESGLDDRARSPVSGQRINRELRKCGAWQGTKKIRGQATKVWYGVTLRADHERWPDDCTGNAAGTDDSFLPDQGRHHKQLAMAGIDVARLPGYQNPITSAHAPAEKSHAHAHAHARGNFSPASADPKSDFGNLVTEEGKETNQTDIPDLDSFDEDLPF